MNAQLRRLLDHQSGVVSRRQVLDAGLTDGDIRRLIRRRELVRVHPGVYVNHTGELTWLQRAWAAVLFAEPAALCHASAIRAADGPGRRRASDGESIHIAIERTREVARLDGVTVHLLAHLDAKTQWNLSPPRVRIEHAVLDVAAEAPSESEAINRLAHAVQSRQTTAERLLTTYGRTTTRLGWGQVFGRPCTTAAKIGILLQQRGCPGQIVPCSECARSTPDLAVTG